MSFNQGNSKAKQITAKPNNEPTCVERFLIPLRNPTISFSASTSAFLPKQQEKRCTEL